ncbi:hypothetical protein COX25_05945, partial [bacterium (Candidatus Howlettbacteria) CG23_combo_of_CG06-09_8_20_14_all_37_9]
LYQTARSNNALTGVDVDCTSSGGNLYTNAGLGHSSYLSSSTNIPNFKSLTIQSTATLTTTGPSGSNPGVKIEFKVKNTITIESTGKIDASGMGYAGGNNIAATPAYGLGAGGNGGKASGGGGAGYGGAGGNGGLRNSTFGVGGTPYNYQDSVFGSGGGSSTAMFTNIGGNGGGAIKIGANNISVNGSILADGTNGTGYTCGFGCSSGSGGGS